MELDDARGERFAASEEVGGAAGGFCVAGPFAVTPGMLATRLASGDQVSDVASHNQTITN